MLNEFAGKGDHRERPSMRFGPFLAALCLALAALGAFGPAPARAQTEVDINQGAVQPLPIAIPDFTGGSQASVDIVKVISANLDRSGLFRPLDQASFPEHNLDVNLQPNFTGWKAIGAQALATGQATIAPDGRLKVDFRLWDVGQGKQLVGEQFMATPDNWRRIAHKISDVIYEKLTGEGGYFDTRVVFVAESGPKTHRIKRLAIMDQDGANPQYLTDGSYIVMSPRFSATSQEITYMALRPTGASVYLLNIETGRQETVGRFNGMVFAPRFSPDGTKVAFTVEKNGNSDVYAMDLRSRESKRLTADPSIDTSPSFSPDGAQLVFNSDRGGSPQLYVMNADGSGVHRISFGEGRYNTPVWSPKGDFIAFTKQTGDSFHIGVMRPDGSDEHILTSSYLDEGPTWAPNGRVLMFEREGRGGDAHLWMVDITGRILKQVPYPTSASDPGWSPLLQ
jgi:TolB protein